MCGFQGICAVLGRAVHVGAMEAFPTSSEPRCGGSELRVSWIIARSGTHAVSWRGSSAAGFVLICLTTRDEYAVVQDGAVCNKEQ